MKYSIIIPLFNCASTMASSVESVWKIPDSEILLIDDGSADETGAMADSLAARYPQIRAVHQAHAGVSAARNRGLDMARGEYILFLDGDDTLDPRGLEEIPPADLVIFRRSDQPAWAKPGRLDWRQELTDLFEADLLSPVWNKRFRRALLEAHGLRFREDLFIYEDLEFSLRYLNICETVRYDSGPVCHHTPSARAKDRVARLHSLSQVLLPLAEANPESRVILPQIAEILARETLAASPGKMGKILKEYGQFRGKGGRMRLIWGAIRLRWRA